MEGTMRLRTVVAATAALSLCVVLAGGAQARTARPVPASTRGRAAHIARTGSAVLYSQMDNDSGAGTVSQNFEPVNDAADSQGADSFTVPGHTTWAIKKVLAPGQYFNGITLGPADSETVTFYENSGGLPGAIREIAHEGRRGHQRFLLDPDQEGDADARQVLGVGPGQHAPRDARRVGLGDEDGQERFRSGVAESRRHIRHRLHVLRPPERVLGIRSGLHVPAERRVEPQLETQRAARPGGPA